MRASQTPTRLTQASPDQVERLINLLRGQKVILDFHLAELYDVPTKVLNQAVKRNLERFPEDFMFRLSAEETRLVLRSQAVTTSSGLRSQIVTASKRNVRHRPYVFTDRESSCHESYA